MYAASHMQPLCKPEVQFPKTTETRSPFPEAGAGLCAPPSVHLLLHAGIAWPEHAQV